MKYIRTKDEIYEFRKLVGFETYLVAKRYKEYGTRLYQIEQKDIVKQADTIEELCDKFVIKVNTGYLLIDYYDKKLLTLDANAHDAEVYGAIWTDEGLIFVAKMNEKGELELL